MSRKHCPKRREFLIRSALQLGLIPAAQLFSYRAFSQTMVPKKNVVFIFFNHSANIPMGNMENNFLQGGFQFGNGSNIAPMNSIAGDALFLRGVNNLLENNLTNHAYMQYAALTAASRSEGAQNSADVLIGRDLQKRFGSVIPYWSLGFNMHQGDDLVQSPGDFKWRTVVFDNKRPVLPDISVNAAYLKMLNGLNCGSNPTGPNPPTRNTASQLVKLNAVRDNLNQYKSSLLVSKLQMEKLEAEVAQKIERLGQTGPDCQQLANPANSYVFNDNIVPDMRRTLPRETSGNFLNKTQAFFDLMVQAFQTDYTRCITYHTNIWSNNHHGASHVRVNTNIIIRYLNELSTAINTLFVKLKAAGIYDETMVVICGSFPHQNEGDKDSATHRGDNVPYLIVNSGASGEVNLQRPIHTGDVMCNIMNRMGLSVNSFGSVHSQLKRRGNFNTKLIV